jgi:hypothetical protein
MTRLPVDICALALATLVPLACSSGAAHCDSRSATTAEICFQPDPNDCGWVEGCKKAEVCMPNYCLGRTEDECVAQTDECKWTLTAGCRDASVSYAAFCLSKTDRASCEMSTYCSWGTGCNGTPARANCSDFDQATCKQHGVECTWIEECHEMGC